MEREFEAFLKKQNIKTEDFKALEPEKFSVWLQEFSQLSENSFLMQKLFYINKYRRLYPLVKY